MKKKLKKYFKILFQLKKKGLKPLYKYKKGVLNRFVVLNSVSNKSKINELLNSNKYSKIYLFLDNDRAGNETKIEFFNINKNCIDCSKIYKNFKDFNEFLVSKKV